MSYEIEHDIPKESTQAAPPRRPDLSTFFSTLREVDTSDASQHHNIHSLPLPENVVAVYRVLGEFVQALAASTASGGTEVQEDLIDQLARLARDPPREVVGVPQQFLDELERVPKKALKKGDDCPICAQPFLEDPYPLVVRLPCHDSHKFDLECIAPWLKVNTTCPLDRKELVKKKEPPKVDLEEDEELDDGMFG